MTRASRLTPLASSKGKSPTPEEAEAARLAERAFEAAGGQLSVISSRLEELLRSASSFDNLRSDLSQLETRNPKLETFLGSAIFNIHLLGRSQVYADFRAELRDLRVLRGENILTAIVLTPEFEPLPFDEAIAYFRSKTNLSPAQFEQLSAAARAKAFTIADGASRQVRASVNELIDEALSEGVSLRDFQQQAAEILDAAGISPRTPWYWETVYRTNLGNSYEVGRWKQITDPDVIEAFPYLRYVHADPTGPSPPNRATHQMQHGKIYPIGDRFWDEWYPKNGFNCRCTTMQVSEADLERNRRNPAYRFMAPRGSARPDPGFEGNAGKADEI